MAGDCYGSRDHISLRDFMIHSHLIVHRALRDFAASRRLQAAVVLSCVGSLGFTTLRPAGQPTPKVFDDKYEIVSLTGACKSVCVVACGFACSVLHSLHSFHVITYVPFPYTYYVQGLSRWAVPTCTSQSVTRHAPRLVATWSRAASFVLRPRSYLGSLRTWSSAGHSK